MRSTRKVGAFAALALVFGLTLTGGAANANELDSAAPSVEVAAEQVAASVQEEVTVASVAIPEPAPAPSPEVKTEPVVEQPAAPEPAPASVEVEEPAAVEPPKSSEPAPADPVDNTDNTGTPVANNSPEPAPAPSPEEPVAADPISETVVVDEVPAAEECTGIYSSRNTSDSVTFIPTGGVYGWLDEGQENCVKPGYAVLYLTSVDAVSYAEPRKVAEQYFDITSPSKQVTLEYRPPRDGKSYGYSYEVINLSEVTGGFVSVVGSTNPWYASANPSVTFDYEAQVANVVVEGDVYIVDSNGVKYTRSSQVPATDGLTFTAHPSIPGEVFAPGTRTTWTYYDNTPVEPIIVTVDLPVREGNTLTFDTADDNVWWWENVDGVLVDLGSSYELKPGETICVNGSAVAPGIIVENADELLNLCFTYEEPVDPPVVDPSVVEPVKPEQKGNVVELLPQPGQYYTISNETVTGPVEVLPVYTAEKPLLVCTNLVDPKGTQFPKDAETCWSYVYDPEAVVVPPVHPPVTPPVEPIVPDPGTIPIIDELLPEVVVVVVVDDKSASDSKHKAHKANTTHTAQPAAKSYGANQSSDKELASTGMETPIALSGAGLLMALGALLVWNRRRATQRGLHRVHANVRIMSRWELRITHSSHRSNQPRFHARNFFIQK